MVENGKDGVDVVGTSFPELDEAACLRAEARMAAGAEAQAAYAQESVMLQMVRAYN